LPPEPLAAALDAAEGEVVGAAVEPEVEDIIDQGL
jgi:hypothetical protein